MSEGGAPVPSAGNANDGIQSRLPFDHTVQFYERPDFLFGSIANHVKRGLDAGEAFVAFTTPAHALGIMGRLQAERVDVDRLCASGMLTILDAQEGLDSIFVDGVPSRDRFRARVGEVLGRARQASRNGRVRAYGEMVDLLSRQHNLEGTLELERMWNEIGQHETLSLLCGYGLQSFAHEADGPAFMRICEAHGEVAPTEIYPRNGGSEANRRELTLLQQRARALEAEVIRRAALEAELRSALAERDRLQAELRRSHEELAGAVRFDDIFVGILGHELRNPLSAITTAASVIRRRNGAHEAGDPAGRIVNNAARMGRLIDQLLDITRIRLGREIRVDRARTDLAVICAGVCDEARASSLAEQIELRVRDEAGHPVRVSGTQPPPRGPSLAGLWDADRLTQMFSLLLTGASRLQTGPGRIVITLDGSEPDAVLADLCCSGAIPTGVLRALCAPFESSLPDTQELLLSLGLGLFISRLILQAHFGTMLAAPQDDDEGTRFVVRLPREPTTRAAHGPGTGART